MALLSPEQKPTIADTIRFDLLTLDAAGCPPPDSDHNTYKIDRVTIYFVERDFTTLGDKVYDIEIVDPVLDAEALAVEIAACQHPTAENQQLARYFRALSDGVKKVSPFYYKNTKAVKVFGNPDYPAWLRSDPDNAIAQPYLDEDGNIVPGRFTIDWTPEGEAREGDYFICWTWTPLPAGDQISAHQPFYLGGNTQITTSIPTHYTMPGKYATLLEYYLPEMFKGRLSRGDMTPEVLDKFHAALAKGFTDIENLANQIIDLLDANSTHESLLPYLSNLFNLKLRGNDPTRWRRQIKNAIPLFKNKGTEEGLREALDQAGITLSAYTQLWQMTSSCVFTEMFYITDVETTDFDLSKVLYVVDSNFSIKRRAAGSSTYTTYPNNSVTFNTLDGVTTMSWVSNTALKKGDLLVVRYTVAPVSDQNVEDYIQALDLADQRDSLDEQGQLVIPLKNWNVHVIEQEDPMFDTLVPVRSPFDNMVVFGKVRTEFGYSENIYNMDEYNGSLRNSTNPCDIDRDFVDVCSDSIGSKFILDLEIQDLSNDKLKEATEIVREFVPFHAVLHQININGGVSEFVISPVEYVEALITIVDVENVLAGNANQFFTRYRLNGYDPDSIRRDFLAQTQTVVTSSTGVGFNKAITLFCGEVNFDRKTIASNTIVEVLAPSANAGIYSGLSNPTQHTIEVSGVAEPLNQSAFTFRLANRVYTNPTANIDVDGNVELPDVNYSDLYDVVKIGYYLEYNDVQYRIDDQIDTHTVRINGYSGGNVGGVPVTVYWRQEDMKTGYFNYKGIMLDALYDLESSLGILNGANAPVDPDLIVENDHFKENFLVVIGNNYYQISDINKNIVTLLGPYEEYTTLSYSGQTILFSVIQLVKHYFDNSFVIDGQHFYEIDRQGNDMAQREPLIWRVEVDSEGLSPLGVTSSDNNSVIAQMRPNVNVDANATDSNNVVGGKILDSLSLQAQATIYGSRDGGGLTAFAVTALNNGKSGKIEEIVGQDEGVTFTIEYEGGETQQGEL